MTLMKMRLACRWHRKKFSVIQVWLERRTWHRMKRKKWERIIKGLVESEGFLLSASESIEVLLKGNKMTQQLCKRPFLLSCDG